MPSPGQLPGCADSVYATAHYPDIHVADKKKERKRAQLDGWASQVSPL